MVFRKPFCWYKSCPKSFWFVDIQNAVDFAAILQWKFASGQQEFIYRNFRKCFYTDLCNLIGSEKGISLEFDESSN